MRDLREIKNPKRGCGKLHEGGCYARGDSAAGGRLAAWSWALGEHIIGGENLAITVPPRQMLLIDLPNTLRSGELSSMADELPMPEQAPLRNLPRMALLDHVGSSHYTPWQFSREVLNFGPSRRIPPQIARIIAKHCPLPIVFTHSWLPMVDFSFQKALFDWALRGDFRIGDSHHTSPTHSLHHPNWGLLRESYHGGEHWLIPILHAMSKLSNDKVCHLTKIMPSELLENTFLHEQIFGISWITSVVYVTQEGDTDETLHDYFQNGIEPVRAK